MLAACTRSESLSHRKPFTMSDRIAIAPVTHPITGSIRPPGSKSITNRALVCAALATGSSELRGALDSEDTQVMVDSLQRLGLQVDHQADQQRILVTGSAGRIPKTDVDLFVGNSGTTIRFLTAMLATCRGRFRLDGVERMRKRPIGDLIVALQKLGAPIRCEAKPNCPPVVITADGLAGGRADIRGDISSQFLSGLLMACPYAQYPVDLFVEGELVSQPYVAMTLGVMAAFGIQLEGSNLHRFHIPNGRYQGCVYEVEPDASAASYFWGAAAITGGRVTVRGLTPKSLQGDVAFCNCLRQMGCTVEHDASSMTVNGGRLHGIEVDMNAISDTVQTLAAVALFASGPTTIRGVAHIRHKETDRIGDLARELRRLGAEVRELADGLQITPRAVTGAEIETYRDHRMAMSLALVGLKTPGVIIKDPDCTRKTYPHFFHDLSNLIAGF